ncbi:MAG: IPT/TIG domain-containing protein, partial [Methanoregula sp.]
MSGKKPTIHDISPKTGSPDGGTKITITGTDLEGTTDVHFGDTKGTDLNLVDDTTITVKSPPGKAGGVDIIVTNSQGTSSCSDKDKFTYTTTKDNDTDSDTGCIWVTTDPPKASIQMDCLNTDKTTPAKIDGVKAGSRTVGVSLALDSGTYYATKTVNVTAKSMTSVSFTLLTPTNNNKILQIISWTILSLAAFILIALYVKISGIPGSSLPGNGLPDLIRVI